MGLTDSPHGHARALIGASAHTLSVARVQDVYGPVSVVHTQRSFTCARDGSETCVVRTFGTFKALNDLTSSRSEGALYQPLCPSPFVAPVVSPNFDDGYAEVVISHTTRRFWVWVSFFVLCPIPLVGEVYRSPTLRTDTRMYVVHTVSDTCRVGHTPLAPLTCGYVAD